MPSVYVAVDLEAIQHNVRQVLARLQGASLLAVVKANAYGHGLVPVAQACLEAGAVWLGVSAVAEGVALREAGIAAPTLVFLPPLPEDCEALVTHDLCATVTSQEHLAWLRQAAEAAGKVSQVQVFLDSGLARPGAGEDLPELIHLAAHFPQQRLLGIYTHFDSSHGGAGVEALDIMRPGAHLGVFAKSMKVAARDAGAGEVLVHAAASAMVCDSPENSLDMARVGTLLYGQYPAHVKQRPFELRRTFEFRARIIDLTRHPKGTRIGYGGEFRCSRETLVATLPVGYSHGLGVGPASVLTTLRACAKEWLGKREGALVRGRNVPIIGRIAMDQCCLDVTDVPEVAVGDEAVLPARRLSVNPLVPRVPTTLS